MDAIGKKIKKTRDFIKHDIWRIRRTKLPRGKSFFLNLLRVIIISIRSFDEDKCSLHASALTFFTMISIVPVAAMAFGIAKGFGFEKMLVEQLREKLAGHEDILANVIQFSHSLLQNTQGGVIAGVGLILLFWAVLQVLGQIENSFNDIWGIKQQRTIGRKFGDYLSLMLICPVIIILSGSVTVFITTQVTLITEKVAILGNLRFLVFLLLKLLPYTLLWGLFTFLYIFMPNTKVRFSSGLLAGVITGTIYQVLQWLYITFQIGIASYNAIYGSFAALPLFMAWLQLSWRVVLYGAEISFAHQNVDTYEFEPDARQASHRIKTLLSLQITHHLIRNFIRREKPLTDRDISNELEIPIRLVNEILFDLVKCRIVSVTDTEGERGYQPALDINALSIQYVIDAMEQQGANTMPFAHTPEFETLSVLLETFGKTIERLPDNKLLKDL
jgi:membrane protein